MTTTTRDIRLESTTTRTLPDVRTAQRWMAAAALLLPATLIGAGRLFLTDDGDTRAALDQMAAEPGRIFMFTLLGYLAMLFVVPAFWAMSRLASRRRPVLALVALVVNLLAYLGGTTLAAIDQAFLVGSRLPMEHRDSAALLIDGLWATGIGSVSSLLFVLGHVVGAILIGLALRGSIHPVGWLAIVVSPFAHVVAFVIFPNPLGDAGAWWLLALGMVMCAAKIVKVPNDEWDVPPAPRSQPHS